MFSLGAAYGKEIGKVVKAVDPVCKFQSVRLQMMVCLDCATIGNDGVSFRSHIDGSLHYITPEKSIEIQHNLGADMILHLMNVRHL